MTSAGFYQVGELLSQPGRLRVAPGHRLEAAWRHTIKGRFTIEPSVGIFNLFDLANFNLPPTMMFGVLNGPGTGSINGTTRSGEESFRVGNGTGVVFARLATVARIRLAPNLLG